MTNDIMTDLLNTIDIKISANSRSFNVDCTLLRAFLQQRK